VRGSRIPDILFYTQERLDAYYADNSDWQQRPYTLVPDLVVEVVSPNDKYSELNLKLDKYREDGVRIIWVIDPQQRKALVYPQDIAHSLEVLEDSTLSGGDVLPGFSVKLADILPPVE
jgi:Uma2 family endonuclease